MARIEIRTKQKRGSLRKRKFRNNRIKHYFGTAVAVVAALLVIVLFLKYEDKRTQATMGAVEEQRTIEDRPELDVQLLTVNPYSRPGMALEKVNAVVIHYTANPGSSAQQNRDYFEGLKDSHITKASSHFVIGLEGEIVQCIPTAEIAYASNSRNKDTISIECCHLDETGKFNSETYESLVELTAWLLGKFNLTTDDIIRHYDVTGKMCPVYYVEHEDEWAQFKEDVAEYIRKNGVEKGTEE